MSPSKVIAAPSGTTVIAKLTPCRKFWCYSSRRSHLRIDDRTGPLSVQVLLVRDFREWSIPLAKGVAPCRGNEPLDNLNLVQASSIDSLVSFCPVSREDYTPACSIAITSSYSSLPLKSRDISFPFALDSPPFSHGLRMLSTRL